MKRALLFLSLLAACGGDPKPAPATPPKPVAVVDAGPPEPPDPLGPRPDLGDPAPYTPSVPVEYKRANGLRVWLLERHDLPIVSIQTVVPAGAAHDPDGKGGLAVATANMLDEGAGKRGPLDVSRDLDRLGATLQTGAYADYGYAQLTVLTKNLPDAAAIYADVVARPRFDPVEWRRVRDLWVNQLKARQSDPGDVSSVVIARKAYPANHPYAHPADGVLASAAKVGLDDVKRFYAARWRPDLATCVVVGDVTRADLDALLDKVFAAWTAKGAPPTEAGDKADFTGKDEKPPTARRVIVVDRPDAPQSVIAVTRRGISAFEEDAAGLVRVNGALGGSFTSRLNQDLREEHGWTYGAHSRFTFNRLRGLFVASAAVQTEHTGDALQATLTDIEAMQKGGLTDEEVDRTKKLARADLVQSYETVSAAAARLGRYAGVGQSADRDAVLSKLVARADKAKLGELAKGYLSLEGAVVVIVGPRAKIEPQLAKIGVTSLEASTPEGD
ncbi:MAG: insulinase family protein [Labilithrix sp.]|nr:insulinase family protein [Labilithrix sp.]MCW5813936.1 insulinase family protein [Labilithrix sp.]